MSVPGEMTQVSGAAGAALPARDAGPWMHALMAQLYPICRSITGDGVRRTLERIGRELPLDIHEVPTGTPVFDWTVPPEWNIRDAYIKNAAGERVVDFHSSNLHVVGYSVPIHQRVGLEELRAHLFTLPDRPDWIPYRTSYYTRTWGFCVTYHQYRALTEPEYEICIDSNLSNGSLTYGECLLKGTLDEEILLYAHVCHPSLCNDNLSGIAVATALGRALQGSPQRRYSYRIVLAPGTIGAITWLCRNVDRLAAIKGGLVLTCVGDPGQFTYKCSRLGASDIDRAMRHVLRHSGRPFETQEFSPYGYDERQFCSPGINLPVGCFMRTPHGQFAEYHTSADDLSLATPEALAESVATCAAAIEVLEGNGRYVNQNPWCEPQLGRRGLYEGLGASPERRALEMAMLWVLNLSDGGATLLDIAERADVSFRLIRLAADRLRAHDLLRETASAALTHEGQS